MRTRDMKQTALTLVTLLGQCGLCAFHCTALSVSRIWLEKYDASAVGLYPRKTSRGSSRRIRSHGGRGFETVSAVCRLRGGLMFVDEMLWNDDTSTEDSLSQHFDEDGSDSESEDFWGVKRLPPPDIVKQYDKLLEQGVDSVVKNMTAQLKQRQREEKAGLPPPEERGEPFFQFVPEWEKKVLRRELRLQARREAREKRREERRMGIRPAKVLVNCNLTKSVATESLLNVDGRVLGGTVSHVIQDAEVL